MKYFLITILGLAFLSVAAMDNEPKPITIHEPYYHGIKQHFVIDADYGKATDIGYAWYKSEYHSMNRNNWKLLKIWVSDDYRKKGIAKQLFKAFYEDAKSQDATHITWQVLPQAIGMSEHALVTYYKSMIKNIDPHLLEKTEVKEVGPEGYTMIHMTVTI